MPGGGKRFNATSIYWDIEPLPETSRELSVTFSRVNGITGPWQVSIPLDNRSGSGQPDTSRGGLVMREIVRQLIHLCFGLAIAALVYLR